jgi:hypothetical protein
MRSLRVLGTILGFGVVLLALNYFRPGMPSGFTDQLEVFRSRQAWFYLHIGAGSVAILLVPLQLWAGPRVRAGGHSRLRRLHHVSGRVAAVAILLSAVGGFVMARTAYGGLSNTLGFGTLAVAWAGTVVLAVRNARHGDIAAHRAWALRAAALTFGAVTLRLWVPLLTPVVGFDSIYGVIGWLDWVPNLIFIEWWLARERAGAAGVTSPMLPSGTG